VAARSRVLSPVSYEWPGLTAAEEAFAHDRELAHQVVVRLSANDPLAAHARLELGIDPDALSNPWHAGFASMLAFIVGAVIPPGGDSAHAA
jgi:hypothetical protein